MALLYVNLTLDRAQEILAAVARPAVFTAQDRVYRAAREKAFEGLEVFNPAFERAYAKAASSAKVQDFIIAASLGYAITFPEVSPLNFDKIGAILLRVPIDSGLEYRRACYLIGYEQQLRVINGIVDPNAQLRRRLLNAYPNDPYVWERAAVEVASLSRFGAGEDAKRVARRWDAWNESESSRYPRVRLLRSRMLAWIGVVHYTKSEADAKAAVASYKAWKQMPNRSPEADQFYGYAIRYIEKTYIK